MFTNQTVTRLFLRRRCLFNTSVHRWTNLLSVDGRGLPLVHYCTGRLLVAVDITILWILRQPLICHLVIVSHSTAVRK
jgi:hypothetical protein